MAAGEPERLEARLAKLKKIEAEAGKAEAAFHRISIGRELLVRGPTRAGRDPRGPV